jgi:hypothetical protein
VLHAATRPTSRAQPPFRPFIASEDREVRSQPEETTEP